MHVTTYFLRVYNYIFSLFALFYYSTWTMIYTLCITLGYMIITFDNFTGSGYDYILLYIITCLWVVQLVLNDLRGITTARGKSRKHTRWRKHSYCKRYYAYGNKQRTSLVRWKTYYRTTRMFPMIKMNVILRKYGKKYCQGHSACQTCSSCQKKYSEKRIQNMASPPDPYTPSVHQDPFHGPEHRLFPLM
jgi:hypothetical protein